MKEKLINYIDKLLSQSFDYWTDEEVNGYKTALISIREFIINNG